MMESGGLKLIDAPAALSVSQQLEEEFAKDRWDAHHIPGLRSAPHTTNYHLDFQLIPAVFRPTVKEFIKFKIATGVTTSTLIRCIYCLRNFLTFFSKLYPGTSTLQLLSKQDMDAFILNLKAEASARGLRDITQHIGHHVLYVEDFLHYLERSQSPLKPAEPTPCIIWPHHYPRKGKAGGGGVKYIPQTVLNQLDAHLQDLSPTVIPIIILLRASGWRISDVLYLKLDRCLEQEDDTFWLVGDIMKTRVLGHKIPITKEVAAVVLAQINWVKQHYTSEENPKQWLFPASKRHRNSRRFQYADPLDATGIYKLVNRLAAKYQIKDDQERLFHFRLHAFRHTKGIELVNNGMSLTMVQQWMAHASPEMTILSAKILDETMRAQWEKTLQHGIVQFTEGKPAFVAGKKVLIVRNEQQAFDPERVRDYRNNTKLPVGNCVKPAKLLCKFTELPCFHCPAYVLTPEDLPALETYEQQLLERIAIGKQVNNTYWIEINQKNLEERLRPAIAMLKTGQLVAKSEKSEREYTPEEWQQRQQEKTHERENLGT
jgi:integrase